MRNKFRKLLIMIIVLISLSCRNSNNKTILPEPPKIPAKYMILHKGKKYEFYNDIERKKFCDSIGISLDTFHHHID